MVGFPERFRELRKEKNKTLSQLAEIFNINRSTLSRYENGKRDPKRKFLEEAADYFNVSVDYLLGKSDIRKSEVDIPEGVKEYFNDEEKRFIIDLLQKEKVQSFLREARGASDHDIAVAIQALKAVREGKEKGRKLSELEDNNE